ncbi:MAG: signal peptidase II [Ilumatobacteraceae bacterium]|nr:signal peptidase II [Ilumatobacteraceae bacterium]
MTEDADAEIISAPQADTPDVVPSAQRRPRIPLLTAAIVPIVLVVDQLTKRWAVSELSGSAPRHVIWTLQWNLTRNSGMAFSQAQGIGPLIGIAALLVIVWLAWTSRMLTSRITGVAAGLIAGGALGNLADRVFRGDRILRGAVIDFIDFQWFPIFNVADMAIDIGGAIFVLWTVFGHRRTHAA